MPEPKDITILIVDDEPALRKALSFDFKRKGFQVLEAANGKDAFELVRNKTIDVVISDIRMPEGDGVELLERIRALQPRNPVVILNTGFADISLEDAYDKGADAVFSKPFDRKVLAAAVIKALTEREERWSSRQFERLSSDFNIDLKYSELNLAVQGQVLNIGRGGIFVSLESNFPTIDARVSFCIKFQGEGLKKLEGSGIIRWVRTEKSECGPTGCGIEFEFLDDSTRKEIIQIINEKKTKSFIPKS